MLFIIYIIIWMILGLAMIITMDEWKNVNWCGVIFFIMTPFIPIIAKFAGIL